MGQKKQTWRREIAVSALLPRKQTFRAFPSMSCVPYLVRKEFGIAEEQFGTASELSTRKE
jgi:hypothetical protein